MKKQSQQEIFQSYAEKFKLPFKAILVLQKYNLLPNKLAPLELIASEHSSFLNFYSQIWLLQWVIKGGIALYPRSEQEKFLDKETPDWEKYIARRYETLYEDFADIPQYTPEIYKELNDKFGLVINSKIRQQVCSIRQAAAKRVNRRRNKEAEALIDI